MATVGIDAKERAKMNAAVQALSYVSPGMIVGLGTGSTAEIFLEMLGARIKETGLDVRGVPTSQRSSEAAESFGVPLMPVEHAERIDVAIDGADEVNPDFALIKGGGAALLREKIIAHAADQFIVVVDDSKLVSRLGAFPLPVEVDPFGFTLTAKAVFDALSSVGVASPRIEMRLAGDGRPVKTDGGHVLLDCACGEIADAEAAAEALRCIPGVVEHGLFVGLTRTVIVGGADGADILEM